MHIHPKSRRALRGFTLVETLLSLAIMALLTALILAGVQNVRERAKIQHCQNNLRELGAALNCYTAIWQGWILPTTGPEDDDLRPLYPRCVATLSVFVCISTANSVNSEADLANNAEGGRTGGFGHSYEYLSHFLFDSMGNPLATPEVKTRSAVDTRADKVWLLMDAVESGVPRVPDVTDNHFDMGGNVLYGDTHVEWVERGQWRAEFRSGNSR